MFVIIIIIIFTSKVVTKKKLFFVRIKLFLLTSEAIQCKKILQILKKIDFKHLKDKHCLLEVMKSDFFF